MSNTKPRHTPGPWKYDYFPETGYNETRLVNDSHEVILQSREGSQRLEIGASNAHLIAAAPDLLEALERITKDHDSIFRTTPGDKDCDCGFYLYEGEKSDRECEHIQAFKAIKKAKGE